MAAPAGGGGGGGGGNGGGGGGGSSSSAAGPGRGRDVIRAGVATAPQTPTRNLQEQLIRDKEHGSPRLVFSELGPMAQASATRAQSYAAATRDPDGFIPGRTAKPHITEIYADLPGTPPGPRDRWRSVQVQTPGVHRPGPKLPPHRQYIFALNPAVANLVLPLSQSPLDDSKLPWGALATRIDSRPMHQAANTGAAQVGRVIGRFVGIQ